MATLTINGQKVTVDDSFRNLSPEQQEATVNEIASEMGSSSAEAVNPWVDAGASFASGVGRGAGELAMLPATAASALTSGSDWLADKIVGGARSAFGYDALPPEETASGRDRSGTIGAGLDAGQQVARSLMDANLYAPKTTVGEYAETAGEFVPGALLPGATVGNALRFGVVPGLASEAAGQLTEGSSAEPYARVAAALLAPSGVAMAGRVVSPFGGAVSAERQALVDTLTAEGVRPTAGQTVGSRGLRFAESELGGAAARNLADDQARAFTESAMSRAGQPGLATADNMGALNNRLSQGFQDISSRTSLRTDPQFGNQLGGVLREYDRVLPSAQREIVNNMADDILSVATNNGGSIPGDIYQATRSRLGSMANNAKNSDPQFSQALRGLRNTLDDAMSRSVSPDDAAEWARLRSEYGNMKVLEKAATGAGENAAEGFISPAKLRQAAVSGRQGQYARGTGDFDELARAGQILSPLPDSGTASRLAVRGLMSTPAAAGAIAGGATGDVMTGLLGAAAGAAVPTAVGRALMSQPGQAYLANQLVPRMSTIDPRTLAVIQGLITNQEAR